MIKQQLTVDGKVLGKFAKSDKIKNLSILKGIEVCNVEETDRERALRLQAQRERREYQQSALQAAEQAQPSLLDGIPNVPVYSNRRPYER